MRLNVFFTFFPFFGIIILRSFVVIVRLFTNFYYIKQVVNINNGKTVLNSIKEHLCNANGSLALNEHRHDD